MFTIAHAPTASASVHRSEDERPVGRRIVVKKDRYNGDYEKHVSYVARGLTVSVNLTCLKAPPE